MSRKVLQQSLMLFVLTSLVLSLVMSLPVSVAASSAQSGQTDSSIQVEDTLSRQFEQKGSAGYLVYFNSKADLSTASKMDWNKRGQFVMETLQKAALDRQSNVRTYLDAQGVKYQSFWIDNVIVVDSSTYKVFNGLMAFPEIQSLKARRTMGIIEPKLQPAPKQLFAVESNLTHINADDVWGLGYEGQGVTIANIDTGVRYTHQAVNAQYRGNLGSGVYDHNYNWFDPYGDHPTAPGDDNGHGTHTMGTMVGDDGGANQTGVAPSANWMACRACNTSSCTDTALLACAQFIAAPTDLAGANPNPSKRPVAVNNSWGDCSTSYDGWYQGVVNSWHAAGIHPIFSNGNASNCGYNDPPGLNTVGNPARYGNVTGVGSSGQNDGQYATHSNWGPTDNLDTINPNPNDAFGAALKPQVLAPGVNIRSSVNTSDSSYESWAGTSMSSPHVTGLIALMVQAAPCLAGDYATVETILEDTAVPIPYASGGSPAPPAGNAINYATGHGEIDALAAVQMALNMCGTSTLSGTVTESATGNPVAGAAVDVVNATTNRHVSTNAAGVYTMNLFDGTYDVTISKYGYVSQTTTGVNVTGSATLNVVLVPATIYTVSGKVTDGTSGWPLYARLNISGYPGGPVFTNPVTGAYSVPLLSGSYTFTVSAMSGGYTDSVLPLVISAHTPQNFGLVADAVACNAPGYGMSPSSFSEDFETWPLTGWTIVDNIAGGGLVWDSSGTYGDGNYTGGAGLAATVDSNLVSFVDYDTELVSPVIDPTTLPSKNLVYKANFQSYSGLEALDLDITNDGGATWTNISNWTIDQGSLYGLPGVTVSVDLTPFITTNFQLRWHYYTPEVGPYDWYAQVDDVSIGTNCVPMASGGLVIGSVFDANTSTLLMNTSVQDAALKSALLIDASADPAAPAQMYVIAEPAGAAILTASLVGYGTDTRSPTVVAGGTIKQDFHLPAGKLSASPASLSFTVPTTSSVSKPLALNNAGGFPADYKVVAISGTFTGYKATGPFAEKTTRLDKKSLNDRDASKLGVEFALRRGIPGINGGAVSASWPTGLAFAWGIGFNTLAGDLWLGNIAINGGDDNDYRFTTVGTNTGDTIDIASWVGVFGGDMTYNPFTNTLWQVNVGGDNCIYELNPVTKTSTGKKICPDFGTSERGLAFDPLTNTYYAGSWEDGVINHFAPDGTILDSKFVGLSVSGLAFNPGTGHLFVMTNAPTTSTPLVFDVYVLDIANGYAVLGGFNLRDGAVKAFADYAQAGLEMDCKGKLWAVDQKAQMVYMADSGETGVCSWKAPWLSVTPSTGTVSAGGKANVTVKANSTGLAVGTYKAYLRVIGNTPYGDVIVPVKMTVAMVQRVQNGSFELYTGVSKIPTKWVAAKFGALDGKNLTAKKLGKASVKITGLAGTIKTLTQTLPLAGKFGDKFTFSFWVKGATIPAAGLCQAKVMLYNGASLKLTKFIACPNGTYAVFQKKTLTFNANAAYTKVVIQFLYSKASGAVWFDEVSLLK